MLRQILKSLVTAPSQNINLVLEGLQCTAVSQCSCRIWKISMDNKKAFRVLLIEHSKVFDFGNHESLIAEVHAYDLD